MLSKRGSIAIAAAATLAVAACGGDKKKTPDNTAPSAVATGGGLWSMTPASAAAGFVVSDGALQTLHAGAMELARIADGYPFLKQKADAIRRELAEGPFDPLDPGAYQRAGIDLSKGLAVWVDASDQVFAVLPVSDPAKFAGLAGGRTVNEGGVDIDLYGDDMRCTSRAGRYVCAQTAAALSEIGAQAPGPLAQLALDSEVGGQIRVVVDPARYPIAQRLPGLERYLEGLGALSIGATLERGAVTVRAHLPGTLVDKGSRLAAAPSLLAGKAAGERPSGAMHVRIDPSVLPIDDTAMLPNGVKISEIVNSLTGEIVALSHAGTNASVSFQLGLANPGPIRKLVEMGCVMGGSLDPNVSLSWEKGACRGEVRLAGMPSELRRLSVHKKLSVEVTVHDDKLDARLALGTSGPVTNAPSPSPLGSDMIAGSWNVSMWGEGLSPVYLLDLININAIPRHDRDEAGALLWLLGHIYEAGMAVGFRDDGLHATATLKTFAAAPEKEYKGYQEALRRAASGNWKAAKAELDALAQKAPGGMVARQVGLKSGAWLGVSVLGGAVGWLTLGASDRAMPPPPATAAPPPPT